MIKLIKLRLRNLDSKHLKKAGGRIDCDMTVRKYFVLNGNTKNHIKM